MAAQGPLTPSAAYGMISISEAQAIVLEHCRVLPVERVPTHEAVGMVCAEAVVAKDPLPPFPASIKDGYAVVASDGPGEYPLVGEALAGTSGSLKVEPGTVAYITTGAPLPPGADAVVMIEQTEALAPGDDGRKRVKVNKGVVAGADVRPVGVDIGCGTVILHPGDRIGIAEVGLAGSVGAAAVSAYRRPCVAVLSNGDEIVSSDTASLGPGQIRDSNRPMLLAAARETGALVTDMGIVGDKQGSLEETFEKAIQDGADVIITSGGVSMGARDLIKPLLEKKGTIYFGKVCMKPGKPLTFATIEDSGSGRTILVFALPGNPVSSYACFHLVVASALRKCQGWREPSLRRVHVRLSSAAKMDSGRPEFQRARIHWESDGEGAGQFVAKGTGSQLSSRLLSALSANALLEIPQGTGEVPSGATVSAVLVDDLRHMSLQ
ncbi:unnamed protein product [Ostreobium quekettii]|uniref:Molybdopterin biosynthesis protein CNX1 n=1 Tax=Ostreobium quekettii TaxID=121088 RepID=A0A8S1J7D1_9CHLO|nr:unnamed protein product [Ostreobium quekettii]|eukprot:evm.model.scf_156.11 EVM.evm.TU.scf_156.11   scf_156:94231-99342(-)